MINQDCFFYVWFYSYIWNVNTASSFIHHWSVLSIGLLKLQTCLLHGLPIQHFIKTCGCDISLTNFCGIQRQWSSVSCCPTGRGSLVWRQRMCSQVSFFCRIHTCLQLLILFLLLGPKGVPLPRLLLSAERGGNTFRKPGITTNSLQVIWVSPLGYHRKEYLVFSSLSIYVCAFLSECEEAGWEVFFLTKLKWDFNNGKNKTKKHGISVFVGKIHSHLFLCTSSPSPHPPDPKTLSQVISTDSVFTSIFFVVVCCLIIINVITLYRFFSVLALITLLLDSPQFNKSTFFFRIIIAFYWRLTKKYKWGLTWSKYLSTAWS